MLLFGSKLQRDDRSKAIAVYRRCIKDYPGDFRAYFNLASLLVQACGTEGFEEAIEMYEFANQLSPQTLETYADMAGLQIKRNRPDLATIWCKKGLALCPINTQCLYNLNIALRQSGLLQEALNETWCALRALGVPDLSYLDCDASAPASLTDGSTFEGDRKSVFACDRVRDSKEPKPSGAASIPVTFVCVKWGTKYGSEYVNALYRALCRHFIKTSQGKQRPPSLLCLTDNVEGIDPAVECLPFPQECPKWRGWWLKGQLFHPDVLPTHSPSHVMVYLDLDVVVLRSLQETLAPLIQTAYNDSGVLTLNAGHLSSEGRAVGINSSIIVWRNDPSLRVVFSFLFTHYEALNKIIYKFDHYLELMFMSAFGPAQCSSRFQFIGNDEGLIADYAQIALLSDADRDSALKRIVIVVFPLQPKPHQVTEEAWVQANWTW